MTTRNQRQQLECNMRSKFAYIASCRDDMSVIEMQGGILVNSNLSCDMFNVITDINVNSKADLTELFNYFNKRSLNFALWSGFSTETKRTKSILLRMPLPEVEKEVGMYARVDEIQKPIINDAVSIQRVSTPQQIQDIITVMSVLLPHEANVMSQYFNKVQTIICSPKSYLTFYVGYLSKVPVATASIYRDKISGGIWDVMTHPKARRQKIGTTMTWAMVNRLKEEKYTDVVLTASEAGLPVYQNMGFQALSNTYQVYNFISEI